MVEYDIPDTPYGRLTALTMIIVIAYLILDAVSVSSSLDSMHEDHSHDEQHQISS